MQGVDTERTAAEAWPGLTGCIQPGQGSRQHEYQCHPQDLQETQGLGTSTQNERVTGPEHSAYEESGNLQPSWEKKVINGNGPEDSEGRLTRQPLSCQTF